MEIKILIADDEKGIRDSLQMILNEEGFATTVVSDGLLALEEFKKNE